ncbi:hypothetical protein Tco_0477931 [Tanacetum coccineum]
MGLVHTLEAVARISKGPSTLSSSDEKPKPFFRCVNLCSKQLLPRLFGGRSKIFSMSNLERGAQVKNSSIHEAGLFHKGTRKPNLGGRRAGRQHTRQETRNLGLNTITDKSGPVSIWFEFGDRETRMPLGEHAAHWANYLGELVRELPLHYPSGVKCGGEKAGTQFDMRRTWNSDRWPLIYATISCYTKDLQWAKGFSKEWLGVLTRTGLTTWSASDYHVLRHFRRSIGMRRLRSGMIPRTVPGRPKINKTGQKAKSYADKDPGLLPPFEICIWESSSTREYPSLIHTFFLTHTVNGVFLNPEEKALYGLGSNTETGVPYTKDEIMAIIHRGKQRGHILDVGRVCRLGTVHSTSPHDTLLLDVVKIKKREKVLTRQVNMFMKLFRSDDKFSQMLTQLESQPEIGGGSGSDGRGDDEQGDDEDDREGWGG